MNEQEYRQRLADERALGSAVVKHIVATQLAMPLGVYVHEGQVVPLPPDGQLTQRQLRRKR